MKIFRLIYLLVLIFLICGLFLTKSKSPLIYTISLNQFTIPDGSSQVTQIAQTLTTKEISSPTTESKKIPYLRNEMATEKLQLFKDTVARQALKYPEDFFLEAPDYDKEVALTFDDGPDEVFTPQILDVLKEHNVKATFFLTGINSQRYSEIVKRICDEGHAIGGHSYNHPDLRKLTSRDAYENEILKTQQILKEIIGYQPLFYRPPYGAVKDEQIEFFAIHNLKTINWSIDTFDWDSSQNSVGDITGKINNYLHAGAIILMHSAGKDRSNTVKALPLIINSIREKGYQLKTIPEMLEI